MPGECVARGEIVSGGRPCVVEVLSMIVASVAGDSLGRPRGVAVDSKGGAIVADLDGRVLRLEKGGTSWSVLVKKGAKVGVDGAGAAVTVASPSGVAVDADDNIYVVDSTARAVYVLPSAGSAPRLLAGDGREGTADGTSGWDARFKEPYSIFGEESSKLSDLHLLIADRKACSIRRLTTVRGRDDGQKAPAGEDAKWAHKDGQHTHIQQDGSIVAHVHPGSQEPHHHAADGTIVIGSDMPPPKVPAGFEMPGGAAGKGVQAWKQHTVKKGETLKDIAHKYGRDDDMIRLRAPHYPRSGLCPRHCGGHANDGMCVRLWAFRGLLLVRVGCAMR